MDPPQCVQNAMMTKDKKPFTYTPGGIDLSEVRSPRMQRRIERNANLAGAGDIPKPQPPPPQNIGALPPSVQVAMRPQPQVQVFPSGPPPPPPMSRGGAPPPPPPFNAPPPPPPPSGPLPTQKVMTGDNQVLERPDMTKIIPDNPMALLRKTGGPAPRRSIVDEMFAHEGKMAPDAVTPPSGQRPQPQFQQQQQRYQPPVVERGTPISPVPQQYQPQPPQPQQYQPPRQQYQPPQPQQQYQSPPAQQRSPEAAKEPPRYQPPVIERQPTIPRQNNVQPEVKTSTAHLGSLYIPPTNQQAQPQRRIVSPPSPPERNTDSPGIQTPPLKEAPRPWQAKKPQQEEIPPWARRNEQERPVLQDIQQTQSPPTQQQQPQQKWPQQQQPTQQYSQPQYNQQQQYNQQPQSIQQPAGVPVRIIIRTNTGPAPYQQEPDTKTEAVYVTQPVVLQHPGPRIPPQQQQQQQWQQQIAPPYKVDNQGAKVIPVAVEGTNQGSQTPPTPGSNRSLNRQQSWSNNPTQSNSFKIIQKITQTDDDEDDENAPITEHGPRYPQNFQQLPADQMRRMKLNEGDQNLMNKFKQEIHYHDEENPRYRGGHIPSKVFRILDESVVDDDNIQREVDPRYRGPAIPSKAFKLLQNMTEGSSNPNQYAKQTVPSGPQPQRKGPQVRTIPVQIEGDDPPQPYVHPSEQVVPEPKKYTGSSIPSRSFKILQAMTAPDNCANVDEQYEATPYEQWGYDPNYPPYPPYWHDYYHYYYQEPQTGLSKEESTDTSARTTPRQTPTPRHTPVPFWNYMPPYPYPPPRRTPTTEGESDAETSTNPRSTPLSFWGEEAQGYPQYPPYYDPYYYSYYYGYPPMYPPYPYYGSSSDTDDFAGYSSTDEMAYYNSQRGRRRNSLSGLRSATPKIPVTPTLNVKERVVNKRIEVEKPEPEPEEEINTSESDSDTETEEDNRRDNENHPLQSIRSVSNIHLYADEDDSHCSDDEVGIEEYTEDANEEIDEENSVYLVDDDSYPHQLSVIYEESERTDSRMRSASALSDSTTIAERSDDEDASPNIMNANKPFKFCVSVTEEEKEEIKAVVSIGDGEIKTFQGTLEAPPIIIEEVDSIKEERTEKNIEENQLNRQDDHIHCNHSNDEEEDKKSDESEDWWGILGKEDDLPTHKPIVLKKRNNANEDTSSNNVEDIKPAISSENPRTNIEETENVNKQKEESQITQPIQKEVITSQKSEEEVKPKNNYARAKSVYDKIEDQFEEEINSGKLIELESFVAKLEQIQKESGLWNIQLPRKVGDNTKKAGGNQNISNKAKVCNAKPKDELPPINKGTVVPKSNNENKKNINVNSKNAESDEIDFWSTIKTEKDETVPRSKVASTDDCSTNYNNYSSSKSRSEKNEEKESVSAHQVTAAEATAVETEESCISEPSKSSEESYANKEVVESEDSSEELDSSEDESEEHEQKENDLNNNEEQEVQPMSIQERIQALKETIRQKQNKLLQQQEQEMKASVKEKISAIETTGQNRSKTTSTKSSLKSFEEYSEEEEGDSGVTSDMSRHISDTEEFPELKKLTRYQRAATHSRLFKLLQDECENEEDEEEEEEFENTATNSNSDKFNNLSVRKNNNAPNTDPPRRDKLSLPLNTNETESLCSSGITSPGSPVNEKLVNELVQSLLKRKKGQIFRNMPKEKLFAAAARILQEDLEGLDASSEDCSSFLSPLRDSTGCSTAAQTPQEFNGTYDEYKQYYETWSEAERLYDENYDILPSKAFKLLQEHSNLSKTGTIAGLLAKCPRVLSSKNIHKKLLKLLESSGTSSPTPENPLESNEVTSAS